MDVWSPFWMIVTLVSVMLARRGRGARIAECEARLDALEAADAERKRELAELGFRVSWAMWSAEAEARGRTVH